MKLLLTLTLAAMTAAAILIAPSARATEGGANSAAIAPTAPTDDAAKAAETHKETASADKQPAADPTPKKEEKAELDHPVHDFSKLTGRDEDSCSACHIPHVQTGAEESGNKAAGDLFKIARQRPALAAGRYTPGPTSMICLTCHNGSIAVSTVGTAQAMRSASSCGAGGWPPSFAMRDHPIGVLYPDRRKGFRPKTRVEAAGKIKLPEGRVECISCHDQHQEEDWPHLLVMSNKRSALCLSCHQK